MDAQSGLCLGCFRSLTEIADWPRLDDAARTIVLAAVARRRSTEEDTSAPQEAGRG